VTRTVAKPAIAAAKAANRLFRDADIVGEGSEVVDFRNGPY